METIFAILLGVIGVVLLGVAAALLLPMLRAGRPPVPSAADLPAAGDDAERQERLAAMRRRRLEDAGGYDFPLNLDEGPQVAAHVVNDENLLTSPPRPGTLRGDVLTEGEAVPVSAERRVSGPAFDNTDWMILQDDTITPPRRNLLTLIMTAVAGTLLLAIIVALIIWLVNRQQTLQTPPGGSTVLIVAEFGEGPANGPSAAGKRLADTLRTTLQTASQGTATIQVRGTGRLADGAAATQALNSSNANALLWGTLPQGETGTLSATLLLRTTPPGTAWERLGAAGRLLLPPNIALPDQELVVAKGLGPLLRALLYYQSGNFEVARDAAATLSDNPNPAIRGTAGFFNANALTALGRAGDAIPLYSGLDAGGWSVPAVLNNWGVAADALGRADEARGAFDRALAANPPPDLAARARILTNRGHTNLTSAHDRTAARADFLAALAADPQQAEANRELGLLAYEDSDVAAARSYTQAALKANPGDPAIVRQMGLVALLEGRTADALSSFQQALGVYEGWIATLRTAEGAAQARNDTATVLQITAYIRTINREEGTTQYYRGLALAEQARGEPPPSPFDRLLRTIGLKSPSTHEQALAAFNEAIRLDQDRADVRYQMGLLAERLGDRNEARQHFDRAKDLDQTLPGPYVEEAGMYEQEKKLDLAIREYEALNQVNAAYLPGYIELGRLYRATGQEDRATAAYEHALTVPAVTGRDHYYQARALHELKRYDEALAGARAAVAATPGDWQAQWLLGQYEQQAGNNTEALAAYRQVLAAANVDSGAAADAAYQAGRLLAATGQIDEARRQFQEALKRNPNHPDAHFDLAELYKQTGQRDQAIAEYTRAIQAKTRTDEAYTLRGQLYEQTHDWRRAESDYRGALGANSQKLEARDGLVRALLHQYNYNEALKVAQDGRRASPDSPVPYVELAQVYLAQGNPAEAAAPLDAARAIAPNDPQVLLRLGHAAVLRNDDASAQQYLTAALQAQPNLPEAVALLGDNHYNHERFAAAADSYRQAIAMTPPDYPPAHAGLGRVAERTGNPRGAAEEYLKALAADPTYAEARLFLGDLYAAQGNANSAAEQYQLAIQVRPQWAQAHYNLAQVYLQTGRTEDAVREYTQATRNEPNFVEAWFGLGQALRDTDRRKEAIAAYQQATKLNPTYAQAWLYLGYTYQDNGQRAEAATAYRQAQDTAADETIRRAAADALARLQQ